MSKEAMKLALEALYSMKETLAEHDEPTTFNEDEAIKALEEALAKQEQHALSSRVNDVRVHIEHGKQHDEAMKRITAKQEQCDPLFKSIIEKHEGLAEELAAMDKEQGEPVAWISWNRVSGESKLNYHKVSSQHDATLWSHFPLYTTPQQRKPLTDEQISAITKQYALSLAFPYDGPTTPELFARAVEAAHGIKE